MQLARDYTGLIFAGRKRAFPWKRYIVLARHFPGDEAHGRVYKYDVPPFPSRPILLKAKAETAFQTSFAFSQTPRGSCAGI